MFANMPDKREYPIPFLFHRKCNGQCCEIKTCLYKMLNVGLGWWSLMIVTSASSSKPFYVKYGEMINSIRYQVKYSYNIFCGKFIQLSIWKEDNSSVYIENNYLEWISACAAIAS